MRATNSRLTADLLVERSRGGHRDSDQMQLVEVLGCQYGAGLPVRGAALWPVIGLAATPGQQGFDRVVAAHGLQVALVWCDGCAGGLQ